MVHRKDRKTKSSIPVVSQYRNDISNGTLLSKTASICDRAVEPWVNVSFIYKHPVLRHNEDFIGYEEAIIIHTVSGLHEAASVQMQQLCCRRLRIMRGTDDGALHRSEEQEEDEDEVEVEEEEG